MSKDFDDIYKKIDQSNKDLSKNYVIIHKEHDKIIKEITEIKKEVKDIGFKVETMLEILNNFTIMLAEEDEDIEENYGEDDSDESWVPKDDMFWKDEDETEY